MNKMTSFFINRSKLNAKAVTLVEILVVSVIVSILALLAMPAPGFTKKKNQELKLKATLDEVRQALYQYEQHHFDYKGAIFPNFPGSPLFPCYEYMKEYTQEVAANSSYGTASCRIVTIADMLEMALLKPTVADIDKRKKIYDFVTGYWKYEHPDGTMSPVSPKTGTYSSDATYINGIAFIDGSEYQKYTWRFIAEYTTPFADFPQYEHTFQWLINSYISGGNAVFDINDSYLLNSPEVTLNGGIIPDYDGDGIGDYKDIAKKMEVSASIIQLYPLPLLPPFMRGDKSVARWDTHECVTEYGETAAGFPANPVIPNASREIILNLPNSNPQRVYWEAHIVSFKSDGSIDKQYWVPFSCLLYNSTGDAGGSADINSIYSLLGNSFNFWIDDIRFPKIEKSTGWNSTFYGNAANFYSYFPLLDANNDGAITDADRDGYENITGERYYWEF